MSEFFDKDEFCQADIQALIDNEAEESIHLDFKAAAALGKTDGKKKELSKDVSAFANSDGGIIIYGMNEKEHKAESFSFIDGDVYTKEWIEQVVNSTIQRHIPDLKIFPVRIDSSFKKSVYVVKIPKSVDTPHISKDGRFYRRFNFESKQMYEYEIRELYNRRAKSKLVIREYSHSVLERKDDHQVLLQLCGQIENIGGVYEKNYKLNLYFHNMNEHIDVSWKGIDKNYTSTRLDNSNIKISVIGPPIFPEESIDAISVTISINKLFLVETLETLEFRFRLFYDTEDCEYLGDFKDHIKEIVAQVEEYDLKKEELRMENPFFKLGKSKENQ